MSDEDKSIAIEAGLDPEHWIPAENVKPIIPSQRDNSSGSSVPYVSSLPPAFQQNADFVGTSRHGGKVPTLSLMPLAPSGMATHNAAIQSITNITNSGSPIELATNDGVNANQKRLNLVGDGVSITNTSDGTTTITSTSTGDGLVHGDSIWEYDSAYSIWRDDFLMSGVANGSIGDLNWGAGTNSGSPGIFNYGGAFPYVGQIEILTPTTAANSQSYITPRSATITTGITRNIWDMAMPLFDYPGWKLTWVFTVRRPDPRNGGSFHAFDATKLSLYVGLGNGSAANSTAIGFVQRPNVFYGVRFDTDTTSPTIADTTYHLEACCNAINNSAPPGVRYNNQGTLGGTLDTGVSLVEGAMHRLEISYLSAGQLTITLDGVGTTFTISQLTTTFPFTTIPTGSGQSLIFSPTPSSAYSNTVGHSGAGVGSLITLAGASLPAAYAGTFPVLQNVSGSFVIATPGAGADTGAAFTVTAFPGVYPMASIAQDTTGSISDLQSRSLVIDYFSLVWNKGLSATAPAPDSTLPRYW